MTTGPGASSLPSVPLLLPRRRRVRPRGLRGALPAVTGLALLALLGSGCGLLPGSGDEDRAPVTVMTWAPQGTDGTDEPGMTAMARAYERWTNAHGGIDGRKLRVLTCNEGNDAVKAASCARRAVKEKAVAVVGSYSEQDTAVFSPLSIAGIPYIGGYGVTPEEFANPVSYPVNGGLPALLAGQGEQLSRSCGKVSLVRPDSMAADDWIRVLNAGLSRAEGVRAVDVPASPKLSDYTDQATKARAALQDAPGGKGCVTAVLGDHTATFFDSFRRLPPQEPPLAVSSVLGSVDQGVLDSSGGASGPYEGAAVTGWYPPPQDPAWAPLRKVIKEQAFGDNRVDATDAGVQTTWIAYEVLRKAVEAQKDGPVTAAKVRESLDRGLKVSTGGLTPTLSWQQGTEDSIDSTVIGFPRMINPRVTFQTVREGRLVPPSTGPKTSDTAATLEKADITAL